MLYIAFRYTRNDFREVYTCNCVIAPSMVMTMKPNYFINDQRLGRVDGELVRWLVSRPLLRKSHKRIISLS